MKNAWKNVVVGAMVGLVSPIALALDVPMYAVSQTGNGGTPLGIVTLTQTSYGLLIVPALKGLPPGVHGFHVHQSPSCDNFGQAAGNHLDPANTGEHLGPYNNSGHLGDMPVLIVDKNGTATLPILAPRLSVEATEGHAIIIHADGDNYTDTPPMGGGGDRIACGIVPIEPGTQVPAATTTPAAISAKTPAVPAAPTPSATPAPTSGPQPGQPTTPATTTPPSPGLQILHPQQGSTPAAAPTPPAQPAPGLTPAASSTPNNVQGKATVPQNTVQLSSTDKLRELQAIRKAREQLQQQANAKG